MPSLVIKRFAIFPLLVVASMLGLARADVATPQIGASIAQVIDDYRERGLPFVYSSNLLSGDTKILHTPQSTTPYELVLEILIPHNLTIRDRDGFWFIVRAPHSISVAHNHGSGGQTGTIEEITVSASRYHIDRTGTGSKVAVTRHAIDTLPDLGDDPIRALQRLPGAAAGGTSAKTHLRGGDTNETGLILNGHRLLDPFHIRDYHSLFSAIDNRAVDGLEVYTGGFPARYGDQLSGVVLIDSLTSDVPRRREIGVSVFNTSALLSGQTSDTDTTWLFTARRSNLDLVLQKNLGKPRYSDFFAQLAHQISPQLRLTTNALFAKDRVLVAVENDAIEQEFSSSNTSNLQMWSQLDARLSSSLSVQTTISTALLDIERFARNNQPEKIDAIVNDARDARISGLSQDWRLASTPTSQLNFGWTYYVVRANYDYSASASYLDQYALYAATPETLTRNIARPVDGESYAAYLSQRRQLRDALTVEYGIRWDKQTYTETGSDQQFSPRLSVLYDLNDASQLRLSWGRYFQSQNIHQLQVEDGESTFYPAQKADHLIAGWQTRFSTDYVARVEIYDKTMSRLPPRFENLFDPLAIIAELEPGRTRIQPDSARSQGIEFSLARERDSGLTWWASYVLSRVEDRVDGVNIPRNWDQRHAAQAGLNWRGPLWDFGLALNVHSGWPKTELLFDPASTLDDPILVPGQRNAANHATYLRLDLRVNRRFLLKRGTLSAFLEISNVTDRKNPCCSDFEVDDSNNALSLIRNDENWLPRLPAIGVLWEF